MREVKTKGKKGTKGVSAQRYGDDLTKKTPRPATSAIPETEVAQQMVNEVNPEIAGPEYTTIPYPADEGVASIRHQISTNNGPVTSAEKVYLPVPYVPNGKTYLPAVTPPVSRLSPYNITLPPLPLWEFPTKLKEQPLETQRQFFDRLNEEQVAKIPYQSADYWWGNKEEFSERLPELVVQKRKLTRYQDPNSIYDVYPGETGIGQSPLNEYTDLNALTYQDISSPIYDYPRKIPYYPNRIPESKKNKNNISNTPERFYVRDALHNNEVRSHLPPLSFDVSGTFNPKWADAKVGVGALTGLGLTAYPFLSGEENENINEIPVFTEAPQAQTKPTLEQEYASQPIPETDSGIWGEKINKLTHPTLKDFLPNSNIVPLSPLNREAFHQPLHQPLTVSSNFNDLVRNGYKRASDVPSELPANTSQATFIAPRELPTKGQTLADYNKSNPPQDIASGPRVLNVPVEKKAVTTKPVQSEDRLTEANLASAMAREAVSPQVLQYGSPAYLQKNKPVDMRQWVRQKYGMSMSPAEMVQTGIMPYEYLQYW